MTLFNFKLLLMIFSPIITQLQFIVAIFSTLFFVVRSNYEFQSGEYAKLKAMANKKKQQAVLRRKRSTLYGKKSASKNSHDTSGLDNVIKDVNSKLKLSEKKYTQHMGDDESPLFRKLKNTQYLQQSGFYNYEQYTDADPDFRYHRFRLFYAMWEFTVNFPLFLDRFYTLKMVKWLLKWLSPPGQVFIYKRIVRRLRNLNNYCFYILGLVKNLYKDHLFSSEIKQQCSNPFTYKERIKLNFSSLSLGNHFTANNMENMMNLFMGLVTSTNFLNASSLLIAHFKIYYRESIVMSITKSCRHLFDDHSMEEQSAGDILTKLKHCLGDWKKLKNSLFVKRVLDILALVISSTLCGSMNLDFNIKGISLFSENLKAKINEMNIIDSTQLVIESVAYFMEVGYVCFTQRSMRPILYSDVETFNYDKKYIEWVTNHSAAEDGDWLSIDTDAKTFEMEYDDLKTYLNTLHATMVKGPEKTIIFNRILNISKLKQSYDRKKNACSMRKAPYVMCYYGSSSVGKTSVASILNIVAVKACGGTGAAEQKVTFNENDDYFSSYKSDTETIVMDDLCNTKAAFLTSSPLHQLIKFNNNNPELAVMAGLEEKGKLAINAKTVVITTNVADLCAGVYSNEPVSILRRIDTYITVTVKDEFALKNGTGKSMLDSTKAALYVATLPDSDKIFPDLWNLTVSKLHTVRNPSEGGPDQGEFIPVTFNGVRMENVSLKDVARYVAFDAKKHNTTQEHIVDGQKTLHRRINICKCGLLSIDCSCETKFEPHDGEDFNYSMGLDSMEKPKDFLTWLILDFFWVINRFLSLFSPLISASAAAACAAWLTIGFNFAIYIYIYTSTFIILSYIVTLFIEFMALIRGVNNIRTTYTNINNLRLRMIEDYNRRSISGRAMRVTCRFLGAWAIARFLFLIIDTYRSFYSKDYLGQSALEPNPVEYESRRSRPNYWAPVIPKKQSDGSLVSDTMTWEQLVNRSSRNCVFVRNGKLITGGFMIKTHMLIVPNHFCTADAVFDVRVKEQQGSNTYVSRAQVSMEKSFFIPGSDMRIFYFPSGGDFKDMSQFFPLELPSGSLGCTFLYRGKDGFLVKDKAKLTFGSQINLGLPYYGASYSLQKTTTFKGLCMGAFISETKSPKIVGFHLAGVTDTRLGASGILLRRNIVDAENLIAGVGILFPAATIDIHTVSYESHRGTVPFSTGGELSPKCPTNYLSEDANVRVFGPCEGGVTRQSEVIVSHISESVEEIFGCARKFGKAPMGLPEVPPWHNWQKGMEGFSHISLGPNTSLLTAAAEDYITPLRLRMRRESPLDMDTIINGKDMDKFFNRMPQNTSVGFPLSGPLSRYCTLLEPSEGHEVRYKVDAAIEEEYNMLKAGYLAGTKSVSIFRASLKDEPVKIGKLKVRVFQAAPVALKMVLREYFLPIVAQLSMYPLISECAVGVNPFSKEWDEMHKHIVRFGSGRIVAGDYSAYDQRMSPALTSAAFSILIELSKNMGYTDTDRIIMQGAATDVIYPMVAYNGTLVQFLGSNPSGHNLTVYINSIANSLISRCAFYSTYSREHVFRNGVKMMTYGDDDIGSVSEKFPLFNNITKSDYIDTIGMVYTPPSKEGEHVQYMEISEVDFLKRKSTYNEYKKRWMGCLELDSIMKSLHVRMKSNEISDSQWAASVVDAAIREYYPLGADKYVEFQQKLINLADRHEFLHHTHLLQCSYTEMGEKIDQ